MGGGRGGGERLPLSKIWESRRACASAPTSVGAAATARAKHVMQRATYDAAVAQHAAIVATCNDNTQRTSNVTCNTPVQDATTIYATCGPLHAPCSSKDATCSMQQLRASCNMQLTPCDSSVQDATNRMEHAACNTRQEATPHGRRRDAESATSSMQPRNANAATRRNEQTKQKQIKQQAANKTATRRYANRHNATDRTQPAPRSLHHAACGMQRTACNREEQATHNSNVKRATDSTQLATCNTQPAPRSMRHATCNSP